MCHFPLCYIVSLGMYNGAGDHFSHNVTSLIIVGPEGSDWHYNRGTDQHVLFEEEGWYSTYALSNRVDQVLEEHDTSKVLGWPNTVTCPFSKTSYSLSIVLFILLSVHTSHVLSNTSLFKVKKVQLCIHFVKQIYT